MSVYIVEEAAVVKAPPEIVYGIIADYHQGHPAILPTRYFEEIRVTSGGYGAGTDILVAMNVFGSKSQLRMTVSEPEPGRVLQEEDKEAGVLTTFTIDPENGQDWSHVTITTQVRTNAGLKAFLERIFTPMIMRRIYREELAILADYIQGTKDQAETAS